ncbi:alpha,alpha-trehalase TreF [Dyella sp.]|jgi:alpha,alpha-trehalase|uniref:alpha,alpha-trehalase TreF n=1 Tax=Dyella sp. TaxID=1869338 RepID=UPI002D7765F4|nr:alpha,alpha-trehalase TreF [Dyella sp.]HET6431523.1 alpha,alpha-trehalase TreF [Dyella sp.]
MTFRPDPRAPGDRATGPANPDHAPDRAHAERVATLPKADTLTPANRYQELFEAVQRGRVFDDSKTFVDCVPRLVPQQILDNYRREREAEGFDLSAFVHAHFLVEQAPRTHYVSDPDQSLCAHIDGLWSVLTRQPQELPPNGSLLPLPKPYVVPGGRFRELYYWDSYFTMLGLAESGRHDLLRDMADNFAWLIDVYGHVPNGNRSYYLSRSQPPVFALMVSLFEERGVCQAIKYLPQLRREYTWWMGGADALRPGDAHRHCVRLPDGSVLNRYWDDRDTPREEAFLEDESTASASERPANDVYRDLRAAAASGWDFSSRWCDTPGNLASIRTTDLLPVDLNCFLHVLESQIALLSRASGEHADGAAFEARASARRAAILALMWDEQAGAFFDYNWRHGRRSERLTAATVTPLFVGIATPAQAARVAATSRDRLLAPGGFATTEQGSAEQWDRPNGWAPLQWIAIRGFERAGEQALSREIVRRWLDTVGSLYQREAKLVEKYVLTPDRDGAHGGHGGEYPLQDGFGWTNGVTRRLLHEDPAHPAHRACARRR